MIKLQMKQKGSLIKIINYQTQTRPKKKILNENFNKQLNFLNN